MLVTSSLFTNAITPSPLVASLSHLLERVLRNPSASSPVAMWMPLEQLTFLCHTYTKYIFYKQGHYKSFPLDQFHTAKQFRNIYKKKSRATGSTLDSARNMQRHILTMKQDRQRTYNVTLRHIHGTIVAVKKQ